MDKKNLAVISKWVLIVGGLSRGYEGLGLGTDLITSVAGSLAMVVNVVIGVAAVYLAFVLLTKNK